MCYKVLLVGLGNIGLRYDIKHTKDYILTHSRAFSYHDDFEIVAGVDVDESSRTLFESTYKVKTYNNLQMALNNTEVSIFVVSTPTYSHNEVITQILDRENPKVILCEKPISYDFSEASDIVAQCKEKKCMLYVNYMRRADIGVKEIINRVKNKEIQLPVRGVVFYSKGLFNSASHFINMLELIFGDIKDFVVTNKGRLWKDSDPEPDFELMFDQAKINFISIKEENYFHNTMEWVAANGRLRYERGGASILWESINNDNTFSGYTVLDEKIDSFKSDFYRIQYYVVDQISRAIKEESVTICTGDDALSTLNICSKIKRICCG